MTAVHRLIAPAGSNMLCAVLTPVACSFRLGWVVMGTAEERQACPVTEFVFCIGVVLACTADATTVQVVVLTLYEMKRVKPLNPTVLSLFLAIPEIFLFISDDSSLILVAYLVHRAAYVLYYTEWVDDEM